jgi:hypothetical protein
MLQFYPLTELVHHIPKIKKVNQTLSNVHTYKTELASAKSLAHVIILINGNIESYFLRGTTFEKLFLDKAPPPKKIFGF